MTNRPQPQRRPPPPDTWPAWGHTPDFSRLRPIFVGVIKPAGSGQYEVAVTIDETGDVVVLDDRGIYQLIQNLRNAVSVRGEYNTQGR